MCDLHTLFALRVCGKAARAAFLIIVTVAALNSAYAASFDCAKASAAREKLICADAALSSADSRVAALYEDAASRLSRDGAKILRENQREWLHFITDLCPISKESDRHAVAAATICLKVHYQERAEDLEQAAVRRGPFLFSRVDHYTTSPIDLSAYLGQAPARGDEGNARLVASHVAYPRIDQPITPVTSRWNSLNVRTGAGMLCGIEACGDGCDDSIYYRIGIATTKLVSTEWGGYGFCPGKAHGMSSGHTETIMLLNPPRRLKAADLFRADRDWVARISNLAVSAAKAQEGDISMDISVITDAAADPGRWLLQPEGLGIPLDPYALGCGYTCTPHIVIPWSKLKDVMTSNPPVR